MFKIFSGPWHGIGVKKDESLPFMQMAFEFRHSLHYFKGAALSVLLCLALHANERGECYPGYEQIRADTGLSRDTIARTLEQLCSQEIDGQRVLLRYRPRDKNKRFVSSNHYILFPGPLELAAHAESPQSDFPDVG